MPGKILGIDISEHSISAVQVISGLKGYEVVSCFSTPVTDNNLEKTLEELSSHFDLKSDKCLLTIPPSNTSFRKVNTPFKDAKKIRQTLSFEIETLVPFAIDERILDYIHTDESNPASILTASINKNYIRDYIEQLKSAGIEPDIINLRPVPAVTWLLEQEITPASGIYLDLEPEHPCVIIFQNKKIVLIRELPCSFAEKTEEADPDENESSLTEPIENIINTICREADRTVYSFNSNIKNSFTIEKVFFGGRLSAHNSTSDILNIFFKTTSERINISKDRRLKMDTGLSGIYKPALMDNALAVSIGESKKGAGFNFRRGEFAVKRNILGPGKEVKRVAILACIFLVFTFINIGVDYHYINKKYVLAEDIFNEKFDKTISERNGVKDIRQRLAAVQRKLKESENPSTNLSDGIKADQTVLDILIEILQRVDDKYDFDIDKIQINNKEISMTANTDNVDTATKIIKALELSDIFIKVEPGRFVPKNERIKFPLKIDRTD